MPARSSPITLATSISLDIHRTNERSSTGLTRSTSRELRLSLFTVDANVNHVARSEFELTVYLRFPRPRLLGRGRRFGARCTAQSEKDQPVLRLRRQAIARGLGEGVL